MGRMAPRWRAVPRAAAALLTLLALLAPAAPGAGGAAQAHTQPAAARPAEVSEWQRFDPPPAPTVIPPDVPALRPDAPRMRVTKQTVSPVDPQLAYAFISEAGRSALLRTLDGGRTWAELHRAEGTLCAAIASVLRADPAVRDRLYYAHYCAAGRTFSTTLQVSRDAGATLETLARPSAQPGDHAIANFQYPIAVAFEPEGRRGVLATERDQRVKGAMLLGTEDGGRTWRTLLNFPEATSLAVLGPVHSLPEVQISALAAHFGPRPRLFVALSKRSREILSSDDFGATWHSLGAPPSGLATALEWDAAAQTLIATTADGTWRLALGDTSPVPPLTDASTGAAIKRVPWSATPWVAVGPQPRTIPFNTTPPIDLLAKPYWVAVEPDGAVLVAGWGERTGNSQLRLTRAWPGTDRPAELVPGVLPTSSFSTEHHNPSGSVWRADGTTFIANPAAGTVRAVAADGSERVVAGTGRPGPWQGEGLPATEAPLEDPWGLALDTAGRLLIVDRSGQRVVRLEEDGTLRTVVGTGRLGHAGDGGPATTARLAFPVSATVDAWGRIYIADLLNDAVRIVETDGAIWTLVGGAGTAAAGAPPLDPPEDPSQLYQPMAVAWDGSGGVYVADRGHDRLIHVPVPPPG